MRRIDVLAAGLLSTVQDGGRHGHAASGVGSAGAMDAAALRLANLLVGNAADAAGLEITLRGPQLRFSHDTLLAITGGTLEAHCNGMPVPAWRPVLIRAGGEISFGNVRHGARSYLAVGGGIAAPALLGSRSTDINAGIGPAALAADSALECGAPTARARALLAELLPNAAKRGCAAPAWQLDPRPWFDADTRIPIRFVAGRHFPQLDNAAQRALCGADWRIGAASNRVGYRLEGPPLTLREPPQLISEGVQPGTVQLPPGGAPIVLMAEAPTCGGYPRIAQVVGVDLARLAQRRPGDSLRFAETSLEDAQTRYLLRERALIRIARHIAERMHA